MKRLHRGQFVQAARIAPDRETPRGVEIGPAGVIVVDLRGEELIDETPRRQPVASARTAVPAAGQGPVQRRAGSR